MYTNYPIQEALCRPRVLSMLHANPEHVSCCIPSENPIAILQRTGFCLHFIQSEDIEKRYVAVGALHRATLASDITMQYPNVKELSIMDWSIESAGHNEDFMIAARCLSNWIQMKHWRYAADPFAWVSFYEILKRKHDGQVYDEEDLYAGLATLSVAIDPHYEPTHSEEVYEFVRRVITDYFGSTARMFL